MTALLPVPGELGLVCDLYDRTMLVTQAGVDILARVSGATHVSTPNRREHIEAVTLVAMHAKGFA